MQSFALPYLLTSMRQAFRPRRATHASLWDAHDVVFNHTAEGNESGPTYSFRGIDNPIYYMLEPDQRYYKNYSGRGNTLNCNHPVVRDFVIDCLRYWAAEMQVDGFRFDLASILGRDSDGTLLASPPLLERIAEDPVLRGTRMRFVCCSTPPPRTRRSASRQRIWTPSGALRSTLPPNRQGTSPIREESARFRQGRCTDCRRIASFCCSPNTHPQA